jgi:pyruvate,water dikinase
MAGAALSQCSTEVLVMAVSWFADIRLHDRPVVGGKGASLGELCSAGISVPAGFVVRTDAFENCLRALDPDGLLRAAMDSLDPADLDEVARKSKEARALWDGLEFPDDVASALRTAYLQLVEDGTPVAVRSSATTEDSADASFAGLQDTYLWVLGVEDMFAAVRRCWSSLYSVESLCYRRQKSLPEAGVAMAVVVQRMVDARTAGVMFTRSPTTGDRSVITLEGAWGLGSAVVSGEVTPDRWVIGKITGEITVRDISDKAIWHAPLPSGGTVEQPVDADRRRLACLSDPEIESLRQIARKVERHYGCSQDIEWAVDRNTGEILLLQSRPETVWSSKEAAPVARVMANPLEHVMSLFGGRR